jgi:hypothetical protein
MKQDLINAIKFCVGLALLLTVIVIFISFFAFMLEVFFYAFVSVIIAAAAISIYHKFRPED